MYLELNGLKIHKQEFLCKQKPKILKTKCHLYLFFRNDFATGIKNIISKSEMIIWMT